MEYSQMIIFIMEIIGTIAFASSGAVLAVQKGMDFFGICVLGVVTAVGGGMTRDVILGNVPGALMDPIYVLAAVLTVTVIFIWLLFKKEKVSGNLKAIFDRIMLTMDSVGLGIFTAVGVLTGIEKGYEENLFLLVFLGTLTGVGGGLLRDMMAGEPPYIFIKHIYACASAAGALACVLLYRNWGQIPALILSSALVVVIRFLAAYYRWNLPRLESGIKM